MRYLALGDSYTIGEGVAEHERWPNQLVAMLRATHPDLEDAHIIARTAWTTDELADAIDAEKLREKFDLVTLLIGVNDQYRSRPVTSFATEFAPLLQRAIGFARKRPERVITLSIPDWGATSFAKGRDRDRIAAELDAYNQRARALTSSAGAQWVDITGVSRAMQNSPALAAPDGLHPSGSMYRRWAELVLPVATDAISATGTKRRR